MNIKQIEEQSGMPRANIRYYEQQGLLAPARQDNGYRDYSAADLETLHKIHLLRELGLPVETIRRLQTGEESLPDVLAARMEQLRAGAAAADAAHTVCAALRADGAAYDTLDAQKYLDEAARLARQAKAARTQAEKPIELKPRPPHNASLYLDRSGPHSRAESQVFGEPKPDPFRKNIPDGWQEVKGSPWKRFFARKIDIGLYTLVFYAILYGGFDLLPVRNSVAGWFLRLVPLTAMLFLEPLLLRFFRTTPGKWLMGLRLDWDSGRPMDYSDGFLRTWKVFVYGMGCSIPGLTLFCHWRSARAAGDELGHSWQEYGERYLMRDDKNWRVALGAVLTELVLPLAMLAVLLQGFLPHSSRVNGVVGVTPEQFAANYNRYSDYLDFYDDRLQPDGSWQPRYDYTVVIDGKVYDASQQPKMEIHTDENGLVDRVAYQWQSEEEELMVSPPMVRFILTVLGYAAAQPQAKAWQLLCWDSLVEEPMGTWFEDCSFDLWGVRVTYDVESRGYRLPQPGDGLSYAIPAENHAGGYSLTVRFVLQRLE